MSPEVERELKRSASDACNEAEDALRQVEITRAELHSAQDEAELLVVKRDALVQAVRDVDPDWLPGS